MKTPREIAEEIVTEFSGKFLNFEYRTPMIERITAALESRDKQLAVAIEALNSIAGEVHDQERIEYWLDCTHDECAETVATDTVIAREALRELGESE